MTDPRNIEQLRKAGREKDARKLTKPRRRRKSRGERGNLGRFNGKPATFNPRLVEQMPKSWRRAVFPH